MTDIELKPLAELLCRQHYGDRGLARPGIDKIVAEDWPAWVHKAKEVKALLATDDASLVKGARVLDSEGLDDKLTIGHPDAYLNAIFDFGAGLLAQWIAKGLQAADVVDGVKHLESAARGLHALAARGTDLVPDAGTMVSGAGQGEAVAWRTRGMDGADRWTAWAMCSDEMAKRWKRDPAFKNGRRQVEPLYASPPLGWTGGWKQVGEAGAMPGSNGGFTMAAFKASDVPEGAQLYVALPAAPSLGESAPEGFALVPREPTTAMKYAFANGGRVDWPSLDWSDKYAAMIAAAPQPSASDGEG